MTSVWDLQKALYTRLAPILGALDPPVPLYDEAPANSALPYVEVARHIATPSDGFDHYLTQDIVTLAVYSDGVAGVIGGKGHVLTVMEALRATLTDARLSLPGTDGEVIRCRYERMDTALDADGRTHVGTILFSILFRH